MIDSINCNEFHLAYKQRQCPQFEIDRSEKILMIFLCRPICFCRCFFLLSFQTVQWRAIKAILIGFSLTAINLFSGTFAFINYTANIFQAAGFDKPNEYKDTLLDPNNSSIIVAVIQILGVYGSTLLVDRIGRKTLLIFSTSGAFVGLLALGIYSYLYEMGHDLASCNWIPLMSFSTFIFISCFGILPLPFVVLTEILPNEVKKTEKRKKKTFGFMKNDTHTYRLDTIFGYYFFPILFI